MSIGRPEHAENADHFMEGGKVDYESLDVNRIPEEEDENKASMLTDQAIEVDYDFERRMLLEKNEMINEVEQSALRINDIMNDMAVVVDESGEHLDIITDELANTH